jgi:hypothetical protein
MLPRAQVALIVLWVLLGLAWGSTEPAPISRLFGQAFVWIFLLICLTFVIQGLGWLWEQRKSK